MKGEEALSEVVQPAERQIISMSTADEDIQQFPVLHVDLVALQGTVCGRFPAADGCNDVPKKHS